MLELKDYEQMLNEIETCLQSLQLMGKFNSQFKGYETVSANLPLRSVFQAIEIADPSITEKIDRIAHDVVALNKEFNCLNSGEKQAFHNFAREEGYNIQTSQLSFEQAKLFVDFLKEKALFQKFESLKPIQPASIGVLSGQGKVNSPIKKAELQVMQNLTENLQERIKQLLENTELNQNVTPPDISGLIKNLGTIKEKLSAAFNSQETDQFKELIHNVIKATDRVSGDGDSVISQWKQDIVDKKLEFEIEQQQGDLLSALKTLDEPLKQAIAIEDKISGLQSTLDTMRAAKDKMSTEPQNPLSKLLHRRKGEITKDISTTASSHPRRLILGSPEALTVGRILRQDRISSITPQQNMEQISSEISDLAGSLANLRESLAKSYEELDVDGTRSEINAKKAELSRQNFSEQVSFQSKEIELYSSIDTYLNSFDVTIAASIDFAASRTQPGDIPANHSDATVAGISQAPKLPPVVVNRGRITRLMDRIQHAARNEEGSPVSEQVQTPPVKPPKGVTAELPDLKRTSSDGVNTPLVQKPTGVEFTDATDTHQGNPKRK